MCASWEQYACPGVPGHEPDSGLVRTGQQFVSEVMDIIRAPAPGTAATSTRPTTNQADWQRSLRRQLPSAAGAKHTYDPGNLYSVHHGVGSETAGD